MDLMKQIFHVSKAPGHLTIKILGLKISLRTYNARIKSLKRKLKEKNEELNNYRRYLNRVPLIGALYQQAIEDSGIFQIRRLVEFARDFRAYYYNDERFNAKMQAFLDGLNDADRRNVKQIFERVLAVAFLNDSQIYSADELGQINEYEKQIRGSVVEKQNGSYQFGAYKFVDDNYEPYVIISQMGLLYLENFAKLRNKDLIDIGACTGDSSLVLAEYTDKAVYAFEPMAETFKLLQQNIELNKKSNIVPVNIGLNKARSTATIYTSSSGIGSASMCIKDVAKSEFSKGVKVKTISLDEYVKQNNLEVGLIKIDTEGAESYILDGAVETIRRFKPALLISIYHNPHDFFETKSFIAGLNCGYKFKVKKTMPYDFLLETMLICEAD